MVDSGASPDGIDDRRADRREALALLGAAAASAFVPATAIAQDDNESEGGDGDETDGGDGNETEDGDGNDTEEGDGGGGGGTEEVIVGPGGDFVFEPEELTIQPGTTVVFTWDSDNHNVNPSEQPEEADWEGHQPIENTGFEYEYTFEVEGEYHYVCDPHVGQGMEGDIIVDPDASGDGGGGGPAQLVPDPAMTLLIATVFSMAAVLGLSYVFMKYGGGSQ